MSHKKRLITFVSATSLVFGLFATVVAPAAQAASGYCGYYSETRAVNSASACSTGTVRSEIKAYGSIHYGPYVGSGKTSWQPVNYAVVDWASYRYLG